MTGQILVLGTTNAGKIRELGELLSPLGLALKSLADFRVLLEVEETGDSFAANARLKASAQARHLHSWVLAEDSGISVDALGGAPGVYSARYAGPMATDADNNAHLSRSPIQSARFEPKAAGSAGDAFGWNPSARPDSATIRYSRSSNIIAHSVNWATT